MIEDIYKEKRMMMVKEQIERRGIKDKGVISAMQAIPRDVFVRENEREEAYGDFPLPIGEGQTISQPYIVALMTSLLKLSGEEIVLEIGTGSGYQAAILSKLAKEVHSIERISSLAERAKKILESLKIENVHIIVGDGTLGLLEYAPYDRIIVTAASRDIPKPFIDQLKDKGIMVIPVGERFHQRLVVVKKEKGMIKEYDEGGCVVVPLIGKYGFE
ncbi:MAG: protein-L-isoaspartate(D-aspartate) O-methyltransferase, partial [bacterium]